MRNGKNPLVWLAIILMLLAVAAFAVVLEGVRRDAQRDRPGGPIPFVESFGD